MLELIHNVSIYKSIRKGTYSRSHLYSYMHSVSINCTLSKETGMEVNFNKHDFFVSKGSKYSNRAVIVLIKQLLHIIDYYNSTASPI